MRNVKRWLTGLLCAGLLCQALAVPAFAATDVREALAAGTAQAGEALEAENTWTLSDLRQQFPEGRYWNHADNPGSGNNDVMHTSSIPCSTHKPLGYNRSTCNHYKSGYYCCWGYADQLGYLYSGSDPEQWTKLSGNDASNYVSNLKVGDIVRFRFNSGAEHSMFVTGVNSTRVYYTDCNVDGKCGISWSRSQTKDYFRSHIMWVQVMPDADTEPPVVSNVRVENVTNTGYDVVCTVTDNVGVEKVLFPSWTTREDGTADLPMDWGSSGAFLGTQNGNTWRFHVSAADHENRGNFITDIRAYDRAGNLGSYTGIQVNLDTVAPVISNVKVSNITSNGYDVSCTVTDNVGVNRVVFPTWTVWNDQDDIAQSWWDINHTATRGTRNGDVWTFHVDIAEHNNEHGVYATHIYAYDDAGNYACNTDAGWVEVPDPEPVITFDPCGGTAEFTTKQLEYHADGNTYGALPEAWMDGYVFDGWYTEATGGTRVSRNTAYSSKSGTTLYAHWTAVAADAEQGWALQGSTLVISAQGAMQEYTSAAQTPWFKERASIRKIVVQNGVTSIGDYAFYGCENVTSISLPATVQQIGKLAFYGCTGLKSITVPESVTMIEDYAFAKDTALQTIVFKGNAPVLGAGIFADVSAEVRYPAGNESWTGDVMQSYTGSVRWTGAEEAALSVQDSELQLDDPTLEALLADSCV